MNIIIDRFEGDRVVLLFPNRQQVIVNRSDLPATVKEGDTLRLNLAGSNDEQAKAVLNEILKPNV